MDDETEPNPAMRPSWLVEPCPPWCTREHREDDHPEDRGHTDDGALVPALLGRVDPVDLRTSAEAGELIVQRYREIGGPTTWVLVRETESDRSFLVVADGSVRQLATELAARAADP